MKKFILSALVALSMAGTSVTLVSCDGINLDDDLLSGIIDIVTNLIGQKGVTYEFSASGDIQVLQLLEDGEHYDFSPVQHYNARMAVTLNGESLDLIIPGFMSDSLNVRMSDITLSNLAMVAQENFTGIDLSDASYIDGTLTVAGHSFSGANVYMDGIKLTSTTIEIGTLDLYFQEQTGGSTYPRAIHLTNVKGNCITENK